MHTSTVSEEYRQVSRITNPSATTNFTTQSSTNYCCCCCYCCISVAASHHGHIPTLLFKFLFRLASSAHLSSSSPTTMIYFLPFAPILADGARLSSSSMPSSKTQCHYDTSSPSCCTAQGFRLVTGRGGDTCAEIWVLQHGLLHLF